MEPRKIHHRHWKNMPTPHRGPGIETTTILRPGDSEGGNEGKSVGERKIEKLNFSFNKDAGKLANTLLGTH